MLIQPFTPHLSEEIWKSFGFEGLAINQAWPKHSKIVQKTHYKMAVQIDGKTKQIIDIKSDNDEESVKKIVMENEKIKRIINDKKIKRIIFVPNKILNIVLKK